MGYRRDRTYRLVFDDPDFEGLAIRVGSLNIGEYQRLMTLLQAEHTTRDEALAADLEVQELFISRVREWNLEDFLGEPVPPTIDGLRGQDKEFLDAVLAAWVRALIGIPDPLPTASGDGQQPSLEASMPMEPLSPSLPN